MSERTTGSILRRNGALGLEGTRWVIPYIDQPLSFWEMIAEAYPSIIKEVYFPLPANLIGSGEPPQPSEHLQAMLRTRPFRCSALLNPITLPRPVEAIAPRLIEALRRLQGEYGLAGATVTNLALATAVHEALPTLSLTASCLMEISRPNQVAMLEDIFDTLVPDNRIVRDLAALRILKKAFPGRIRFIVNEACLPGCPFRVEHFHEMANSSDYPLSLCTDLLNRQPWMRLTGGWVLPQHLHLYDGVYDELKLAGRVTLRDPQRYLHVLNAYVRRLPLTPDIIGGGPASVLMPLRITEEYFAKTLHCQHNCHACSCCRDYLQVAAGQLLDALEG